jgi:hypothetical protein
LRQGAFDISFSFDGNVEVVGYVDKVIDFTNSDNNSRIEVLESIQKLSFEVLSGLGLYKPFISENPLHIVRPIAIYTCP